VVSDVWLAAIALEQRATLVIADRDFLLLMDLRIEYPLRPPAGS
jgi:predicted nucleic acid-binding protein